MDQFCERSLSPFVALDIVMVIVVLGAFGFLVVPYVNVVYHETVDVIPMLLDVIGDVIYEAPMAYIVGLVVAFSGVIFSLVAWEILEIKSRKCGRRDCKGLRKAVEFDIQLESEECVKYSSLRRKLVDNDNQCGVMPLELGKDYKELEVELKKMAPLNGRTVLVFRAPCGCPAGRLEVWGAKRVRRIKK
ncbi:ribosomal protein L34Ae [Tanacetum coccineum]